MCDNRFQFVAPLHSQNHSLFLFLFLSLSFPPMSIYFFLSHTYTISLSLSLYDRSGRLCRADGVRETRRRAPCGLIIATARRIVPAEYSTRSAIRYERVRVYVYVRACDMRMRTPAVRNAIAVAVVGSCVRSASEKAQRVTTVVA